MQDVVMVGAGAAGLNAALVLARARHRRPGRGGRIRRGADRGPVDHIDPGFFVHLADGPVLRARRVLVATGLRDELPEIAGVRERWGKDLLHCPYCHGYEVRDQPIGVLGTHPGAVHHALLLRQWSGDVVFFPHTLDLTDDERERLTARGVHNADGVIKWLVVDDDRLRGVELTENHVVPRSAVFVLPRMVPHDALLAGLGCEMDEDGWVITDASGRTSVLGVWAVGNVADRRAQVVTAAGMGSTAAIAINHDLVEEEVARAVEDRPTADGRTRALCASAVAMAHQTRTPHQTRTAGRVSHG